MKKIYARSNLLIVLLLLLVGTIVYSCRKDKQENLTEQAIADQQVSQVKIWYESNFSSNNTIASSLATRANTTSTANPQSWDHIFSPAWAKVNTFVIDSITYFELPVVKTNGDFAISRKDIGNAKYDFSKSMSRSSIILRKSKTGYAAYLMTILADSSYLNGDFSKLVNNTYQKKDKNFSGLVFFHALTGAFNNGWRYNDGKVTGTISQKQSISSSDKTVLLVAAPSFDCQTIPIYSTTMTCTTNGSGAYDITCNENTHVDFITICGNGSNNPPNIGGAGNPGNTGAGGSGGITAPPNPNPLLNKLMKNPNVLSQSDKDFIEALLNKINKDCIGRAIYNYLTNNNVTFDFATNSSITQEALYNPTNSTMTIKNPSTTATISLQEELFHAYQNKTYSNGISQYLNAPGGANIEFESKVIRDLNAVLGSSNPAILTFPSQNYQDWLKDISSGFTAYPTSFNSNQSTQYFGFMQDFINQVPGYSGYKIDGNFTPQALFKLTNSTNCNY